MNFEPPKPEDIKSLFPQFVEVHFLRAGGFKAVYKIIVNDSIEAFKIVYIPDISGADPEVSNELKKESLGRVAR